MPHFRSRLSLTPSRRRPRTHGANLHGLAVDPDLVPKGVAPRFPHGLLKAEDRLERAELRGDRAEADAALRALTDGIALQLERDNRRLQELPDDRRHEAERDFLRVRMLVLDTRLRSLTGEPAPAGAPATAPSPVGRPQPLSAS